MRACAGVREGLLDGKWAMITGENFALKCEESKGLLEASWLAQN